MDGTGLALKLSEKMFKIEEVLYNLRNFLEGEDYCNAIQEIDEVDLSISLIDYFEDIDYILENRVHETDYHRAREFYRHLIE